MRTLLFLSIALAASACSRDAEETSTLPDQSSTASRTSGDSRATAQDLGPSTARDCELQPVYFGYDSSDLDARTREALAANAQCLRVKPDLAITVVGMTDPRGTEEYNLALGDRRARAVMQYLTSLGVTREGLSASSMGEEMAQGEDESGWRNDRKVTFTER